jgi:periplasmic divalent cation tolerance protein
MSDIIIVLTTVSSQEEAKLMCRSLLEKRLVACAQIDAPVESLYWWNKKIEEGREYRLQLKTRQHLWNAVETEIKALHSYDVPEIIAMQVFECSDAYEKWMREELS